MSKIHIARDRQLLGQFTPEEVAAGLADGRFLPGDLAWQEGMPSWVELRAFPGISAGGAAPPPPLAAQPEYAGSPEPIYAPGETSYAASGIAQPAWERRAEIGFTAAILESVKQVLTAPGQTFSSMPRTGGYFPPLLYNIILSWIGFAAAAVYQIIYFAVNPAAMQNEMGGESMPFFFGAMVGITIFMPVFIVIGAFIGAAFMHLFLWIVGGAKESFETTFRVLSYVQGSTSVLYLIPLCGGFIYTVWYFIAAAIGLSKAHQTEVWRVVLAMLLPLLLCCGLAVVAAIAIPGFVTAIQAAQGN